MSANRTLQTSHGLVGLEGQFLSRTLLPELLQGELEKGQTAWLGDGRFHQDLVQ